MGFTDRPKGGRHTLFDHHLTPHFTVLLPKSRALATSNVIADSPWLPIEGVNVFLQAVPSAVESCLRAITWLKKSWSIVEDDRHDVTFLTSQAAR
jgi:hypothetical protein